MAYGNVRISRHLKEQFLGYRFVNGFELLVIQCYLNSYTTRKLENKAVLNLKKYCVHCYVTLVVLINGYEDVYPLFTAKKAGQI